MNYNKYILMIHIIKDLLNPYNWIKLARNPSKFKKVFNDRINYYPGLKYGYTRSKIIKKFYINFNMFFAKKNKQFDDIFFKPVDKTNKVNIGFNMNNGFQLNEQHYNSLKENGVLVLKNALPEQEREEICKKFNKIKNDIANNSVKDYQLPGKDTDTYNKSPDTLSQSYSLGNINPDSTLAQISNQITKSVYGQSMIPSSYYMYTKSINLPEKPHDGDNVWHSDRYLPNLKLIYYPFGVKIDSAPFRYSLGSHKINRDYLNFFVDTDGGAIKLPESKVIDSDYGKKFLKNPQELVCEPNTLAAALVSGFHGRTPFKEKGDRSALFLCYPNFNLFSLISFWRYNS